MDLSGRRVLLMATSGFEEEELFGPLRLLRERGAEVRLAAPTGAPIQATVLDDPGRTIRPDLTIAEARAESFDALVLPGGVINPDALRTDAQAVALIRAFAAAGRPVAAICHGPWLLVEADLLRQRRATCWRSIRTDLRNAGATVVDADVVVDGALVTARCPDDVPAFVEAIAELLLARP
ncbi:type 1 glutamine amidotransferase [Sphingomonas ginkgonis]|uniref:Type 1 glutamine amidotransferase n=1 Tax=Sphingomonas ginkgonis TaxID=2315330 RepID=A0A429VCP8_9SPHN|nr:type 1 glutamine amidotransferase domain-containing protein [Sphingomonas ginkgonis]RST31661.1 type 1 glutamine amidotransferase [Sphingomonas ginkgonis]